MFADEKVWSRSRAGSRAITDADRSVVVPVVGINDHPNRASIPGCGQDVLQELPLALKICLNKLKEIFCLNRS
jgi:hypothetical protein